MMVTILVGIVMLGFAGFGGYVAGYSRAVFDMTTRQERLRQALRAWGER